VPEGSPDEKKNNKPLHTLRLERNRWFENLDVKNKNECFFELELFLKALDRFCNVRNHPISEGVNLFTKDFSSELIVMLDTINRVLANINILLPEKQSSAFHFQTFVEWRLLSDRARMELMERSLRQNTPEESLFVLKTALTGLREVINSLTALPAISFHLFNNIGHIISREIAWSTYFNPFQLGDFSPVHDKIRNPAIRKVIKQKVPTHLRKEFSVAFIIVFRLLRYLTYVKDENATLRELKRNLAIFALLRSEMLVLADYLERELPLCIREKADDDEKLKELSKSLDSLSFQIAMEIKKVFQQELKDAGGERDFTKLSTGIARSKGVLVEILRQTAVQLTQMLEPSLEGRYIFRDYISKTELSLKLRKDIWIFHKVVENVAQTILTKMKEENYKPIIEALKSLRNYIFYFQNVSFQMVRYTDRDAFLEFFKKVDSIAMDEVLNKDKLEAFYTEVHAFQLFLETTLTNLSMRAELKDLPFGVREGEAILQQFLK
jgi:hypothetical protein